MPKEILKEEVRKSKKLRGKFQDISPMKYELGEAGQFRKKSRDRKKKKQRPESGDEDF